MKTKIISVKNNLIFYFEPIKPIWNNQWSFELTFESLIGIEILKMRVSLDHLDYLYCGIMDYIGFFFDCNFNFEIPNQQQYVVSLNRNDQLSVNNIIHEIKIYEKQLNGSLNCKLTINLDDNELEDLALFLQDNVVPYL